MLDEKTCEWLMDNADVPIRYRVARELLGDDSAAKGLEMQLLEHPAVLLWLSNLKSAGVSRLHGSFDTHAENAAAKLARLGLHGGLLPAGEYVDFLRAHAADKSFRANFSAMLAANLLGMLSIVDDCLLRSLDELYAFVREGSCDLYISPQRREQLTGVPRIWRDGEHFIKPELTDARGFCFPLIYDILALSSLYGMCGAQTDAKIDAVIGYISTDEYHSTICDGYGILVSGEGKYHSMGWDAKYPGWFDIEGYLQGGRHISKLLFFAEQIAKYPGAASVRWLRDLRGHLRGYSSFPKEWLPEGTGYAVLGHHMSYGENRRKRNWAQIESAFYMQLLEKCALQ